MALLAIFVAGGLGALARYGLSLWLVARAGVAFPWPTLVVNVLGCLAIGVAAAWIEARADLSPAIRLALVPGLLGGFTTFSAFGLELWQLLERGALGEALAYAGSSLVLGLLAVVAGSAAMRAWA